MSGKFFLDTNIFVYSFDIRAKKKQKIARDLISTALSQNTGIISYQVVQEFLSVATRKFVKPLTPPDAKRYLSQILYPLCDVLPSESLYASALDLSRDTQYGFYDSLIVASAITSGCKTLYTEDLCHERTINTITIINPFK